MAIDKFELIGDKPTIIKDPEAILDYTIDLAAWLAEISPPTDTIIGATATVAGGITLESLTHTDTTITIWLGGGTIGGTASAVIHFVTSQNREDDRTLFFKMKHR